MAEVGDKIVLKGENGHTYTIVITGITDMKVMKKGEEYIPPSTLETREEGKIIFPEGENIK